MNNLFLRQQDAVSMLRLSALDVSLIGVGAIGSTTAVWLGKMGANLLQVFDPDIVEEHNWSSQCYREVDVGKFKCDALLEVVREFSNSDPILHRKAYVDQTLSEVVISGVDSMESRSSIWKGLRERPEVSLYIDARMGLETLVVHTCRPAIRSDRVRYSETLCKDSETLQEPCTARTICYTPLMAASITCDLVKRYVNNEMIPCRIVLDLTTFTLIT